MKTNALLAPFAMLALLVGAGCGSSRSTRITEKAAVFEALPPEQRQMIQDGQIEAGFTADMVYIAMGQPTRRVAEELDGAQVEAWTYENYVPSGPWHRKGAKGPMNPMSKGSSAWPSSLPSDASAHGDMVEHPRSSSGSGGDMVGTSVSTLKILFRDGKVVTYKIES